ncbi:putative midasin protein [Phaeoacremonium minimum UCRPA7]|uniref:Putative midasin protein n=1 Tax=Phaeoacremonium minimum (strain UCR-PA7) TaxID=1286976 RepID=R8BUK9_PHAM7|nr:putative midasin protein [Phaeoacremonium minimum UCRPA7]EOO03061.1 putative midasin protein [Phaeoacremonium minimum UCRPA7]
MAYNLSRSFTQLASEGFCTPQEKSNETSGDSGKLESGTGLGDGEGADDISKDIQPDEDLSELAQEPDKERDGEIEDEKDAVDMANEEMEGQMGDAGGEEEDDDNNSKSGDENEEDEMDEEVGDVDDLDPTAVDEKMWDGDEEDADKDQQGDQSKGQKKDDEQMAADGADKKDDQPEKMNEPGEPEVDEEIGPEQDDVVPQDELNRQDQNVQENETLALPDEMEIDKNQDSASSVDDGDLDALSEKQDDTEEQSMKEPETESVVDGDDLPDTNQEIIDKDNEESEALPEGEELPIDDDNFDMDIDEQDGPEDIEEQDQIKQESLDNANADQNAAPSDVKSGAGQEQDAIEERANEQDSQNKASQRDRGEMGQNAEDQETAAGNEGSMSRLDEDRSQNDENKPSETSESQPFKQLGDAMERWYRNQKDIKNSTEDEDRPPQQDKSEAEMMKQEFQHLQNDDSAADAEALGTASEEEVRPIDDSMAIDDETRDTESRLLPEDIEKEETEQDQDMNDKELTSLDEQETPMQEDSRSGVATRQGAFNRDRSPSPDETIPADKEDKTIQETSTQLSITHITDRDRSLRDYSESLEQWASFQTKTHPLSLALTSQLRLILTPSQSTKLSGSYRTGKRLNIKKIIPYIASSYKRDKIWMRRSIPTKRAYQILLCVDDSRSMGETTSGGLALESLVMVSRSLAMLEAGQVGVLGFGADVFTAHELTEPFASHDAGARVLQKFSFEQDRTDICLLIRQTIDQFRAARLQSGSRGSEDLWQLALILSDGLTPSSAHDKIRRLLREAMEERIMIVFIIMDDSSKKKGDSVLELKEAKFVKDEYGQSNVVIERYLDTFPFQYYLIVHNLEDLPGALAGLLRTWFAEVNS